MNNLFKKKYLIGIYSLLSEGEQLLALVNNALEFAQLMGIKYSTAVVTLNNLFKNKTQYIRYCGKIRTVAFIEDIDDSDK